MSANLDDFERELMQYSELGPIPEVLAPPPLTIQKYEQMIRENNAASIFDADYSYPEATNETCEDEEIDPEEILYRNEHHVTRITSGRGRGGRNIFHPPGHQVGLSEDDLELIRDIRKVAPLGYSNEITENAIRAHQRAKRLERDMEAMTIAERKNSTSPESEASSQAGVKSDSDSVPSATSPSRKEIDEFEDFIKQETPSPLRPGPPDQAKRLERDMEAMTIAERKNSTSPKSEASSQASVKSDSDSVPSATSPSRKEIDEFEHFVKQETPSPSRPGPDTGSQQFSVDESGPVPISSLLKQCRERHKLKQQLLAREKLENEASSGKDEAALCSSATAERQKLPTKSDGDNGTENEQLQWRQRGNSPPRYAWGEMRCCKRISLKYLHDFPPLP